MKSLKYMAAAAAALLLASCTLELQKTQISPKEDMTAPVLNPVADIISDANTSKVEQVNFTWSAADFGASTQILYSVYAKIGEKETILGQDFKNSLSLSKGDLVGMICNELGGAKNANVKVSAYVSAAIDGTLGTPVLTSKPVSFSVFTYLPPKKNIWLPGRYQGWSQFGTEIWETEAGTNTYRMLVDVSNDEETPYYFKIVDESQAWVGMKDGYTASGWTVADPSNNDGNFSVTADEPMMWITVNTKKKTVEREVVTKVALIGGFNNWDDKAEPEFTYDAAENVWRSPVITFAEGSDYLVRLNGNWDHKYGSAVATTDIEGGYEITQGGANIPAPGAGDYVVCLHANRTPVIVTYEKQ